MLNVLPTVESNLKGKKLLVQKREKTAAPFEELLGGWVCHQLSWDGTGEG